MVQKVTDKKAAYVLLAEESMTHREQHGNETKNRKLLLRLFVTKRQVVTVLPASLNW